MTTQSGAVQATVVERRSDLDLFVTRSFNFPARRIFAAWSRPDLMKRWWVPESAGMTLVSCELDVRTGGSYRFEFNHPAWERTMAFFGKYLEVVPNSRIVWTNEESDEGAISTLTLEEKGGRTELVLHEHYATKEAFDALAEGTEGGMPVQLDQLENLLAQLGEP